MLPTSLRASQNPPDKVGVPFCSLLERQPVADQEGGVDLAILDAAQQVMREALDVGLSRPDLQTLFQEGPERELVEKAAVDPGT